jgi:hypothetical protein
MRFATYILLIFCMSVVAYWMGVTSPFWAAWEQQGEEAMGFESVMKVILGSITVNADVISAALLALVVTAIATSLLGGFSATFVVPLLLLLAVAQYFILPISFLFDLTIPIQMRAPLIFLLNMMMVLAIMDFIRGKT